MAANQVKFYIYKTLQNQLAKRELDKIAQLAWRAALEQELYPTRILIRSDEHDTTQGKPDPLGSHFTVCFKNRTYEAQKLHVAYHAYTKGKGAPYEFIKGTFTAAKPDTTKRGTKGEVVWDDAKIMEVHDVVYVDPKDAAARRPPTPNKGSPAPSRPATPSKGASPPKPAGKATPPPASSSRPSSRGSTKK